MKIRPAKSKNSFDCFSIPFASAMIITITLPKETVKSQMLDSTDFMLGGACNIKNRVIIASRGAKKAQAPLSFLNF